MYMYVVCILYNSVVHLQMIFNPPSSLFPQLPISGVGLPVSSGWLQYTLNTRIYRSLPVPDAGFFSFIDIRAKADVHAHT